METAGGLNRITWNGDFCYASPLSIPPRFGEGKLYFFFEWLTFLHPVKIILFIQTKFLALKVWLPPSCGAAMAFTGAMATVFSPASAWRMILPI